MHILGFQAVLVTRSGYRKFCIITICIFIPDIYVLKMKMYSNVHFEVCEAVLSLSLPLVHPTCPCYLSFPLVLATCPCHLSLPLVLATCPCHLSLPLVLVRCFFYGIGAGFFFFCVGKARPSPFNPSGFRQRGSLKSRLNLLFQMM